MGTELDKINIKWLKDSFQYSDGFCVISDNNEQCSIFSCCKDYVQDLYAYFINNKISKASYSFRHLYVGSEPSKTNIKVAYKKATFDIAKALDYIHQVEEALGFSTLSEIKKCNFRDIFIAIGGEEWLLATPMISFYTFLLRSSHLHVISQDFRETFKQVSNSKHVKCVDNHTAKGLLQIIGKIIEVGVKKIFSGPNYPDNIDSHMIGISGFVYKLGLKHWYKDWYDINLAE